MKHVATYKKFILTYTRTFFFLLFLSAMLGAQFATTVSGVLASAPLNARSLESPYVDEQKQINLSFRVPQIVKLGEYDLLKMEGCSYISIPGHPQLPIKSVVVKLPLKSNLTSCDVNVESTALNGTYYIAPALRPIPTSSDRSDNMTTEPDPLIYDSGKLYPERWFNYRVGNGIDPETQSRVTYLVIYFYPLRYMPAQRKILFCKNATITILYKAPIDTAFTSEELDNLIITSSLLEPQALRLARWKNFTGIKSRVLTTEWIYDNYHGVDDPEKIRNCIKDFVSRFHVTFVTIFGDADIVPVRYAYVPDESGETYVPTDLYYADLDYTWDDNGDGLYADIRYDVIDGVPDVYVGRIPPSLPEYAEAVVTKIIGYSTTDFSESWFDRALFVTGTPDGLGSAPVYLKDYIEAEELIMKKVIRYNEPSPDTLTSEINKGCAFVNFAGHGDPSSWLLYKFLWIFPVSFTSSHAFGLTNGLKLPVVTTMACSTARFDDQDCIGEAFVCNLDGGSIAYFGSTRIAWGYKDEWIVDGLMGEMDWRIYQAFLEGYSKLGEMWGVPVTRYVHSHGLSWIYDEKTIMEFALLGDPTLDIGVQFKRVNVNPTSGPVGTSVRVIGEIDTIGGDYHIIWDSDIVKTGKCAEGSTHVDDIVKVPSSILGSHYIGLRDVNSGAEYTEMFTVTTSYQVEVEPNSILIGETTTISVTIHGGLKNFTYQMRIKVTNPIGETYTAILTLSTNATGSGEASKVYPTDFTDANTDYAGIYNIIVDETSPETIPEVATGSFTATTMTCSVHLESIEDMGRNVNFGYITFDGTPYSLPADISKKVGSHQATYNPASGYRFDHWETSGGVSITNSTAKTTTVTVSGDGTLRAIYTTNNPPTTPTVISPNGGEIWTGTHDITWTASIDPDGDPVTYEIEYSYDGGGEWYGLVSGISSASYSWNTTAYPDSTSYLIRVRAYDGEVYSDWDQSDSVFTIDNTHTMHVGSIDMSKRTIGVHRLSWTRAMATVTVVDAYGNPVEGATVYGHWSGSTSGKVFGATDTYGRVTFKSKYVMSMSGVFTFTVDDVFKKGWLYDPNANEETSDSIS